MNIYKLKPHIKSYDWGSNEKSSWVGRIATQDSDAKPPYAEAWFGNHTSGSSLIEIENKLTELIDLDYKLNFLGKVLSIERPLSIQLHPTKQRATQLHKSHPNLFKDDNEKNEIAIALSDLSIAAGFLEKKELELRKSNFPTLNKISKSNDYKEILKTSFNLGQEQIKKFCVEIYRGTDKANSDNKLLNKVINQLSSLYPNGNVGVIVLLLMNILEVSSGTAVYTPAGYPHAYLSGELIEIMTRSDNVIRAGLTSKNIDFNLFMENLVNENSKPEMLIKQNNTFYSNNLNVKIVEENALIKNEGLCIMLSLDAKGIINDKYNITPYCSYLINHKKNLNLQIEKGRVVFFYASSI